jgi:ATP-binding cassette subfamily C protein
MTATLSTWRRFVADTGRRLGWRRETLVAAMIATGFTDGLRLASLFLLLPFLGVGSFDDPASPIRWMERPMAWIGLTLSLKSVAGMIIAMVAIGAGFSVVQGLLSAAAQNRYIASWRNELFAAYLAARASFFARERGGDLTAVLLSETTRLGGAFYLQAQMVSALISAFIYLILALWVSAALTLALIAAGTVLFFLTRVVARINLATGREISRAAADLQSRAQEFLGAIRYVKIATAEPRAAAHFAEAVDRDRRNSVVASTLPAAATASYELVAVVALVVTLLVALDLWAWAPADAVIVLLVFSRLYPRVLAVQQTFNQFLQYLPSIEAVERYHAAAVAAREPQGGMPASGGTEPAAISIRDLHVRYGETAVLDGVDLDIPAGAFVGIVGPSGAGKTTLVDAILRLVEPDDGVIRIDGRALAETDPNSWRRQVGYVPQETHLFNDTVRANLAWSDPDATPDRLSVALRAAAAEFVLDLPGGLDAMVGERGGQLSGGQRQRLGLARALVRPCRLLILDEATNALDTQSEAVVMRSLDALRGQVTIIAVAHRLSTLRDADTIHVVDAGRIVESGSFETLVAARGRFHAMWAAQRPSTPFAT